MPTIETLVIASHNAGKVREIRELLTPFGITTRGAAELGLPEPEETESTFAGNARLKAIAAMKASGLPALADDSGLAVDALGGDPGIYAARWAETEDGTRDFDLAMERVWSEIHSRNPDITPPFRARFICALCIAWPDGHADVYEGRVEGEIVWPPRGTNGFGYDPIFQAIGDNLTFGEIDPDEKHAKSHRADAFAKFVRDQFPAQAAASP